MSGKWYVINVAFNREEKVIAALKADMLNYSFCDKIYDIVFPVEKTFSMRNGKRVDKIKRIMPGYLMIKMDLTPEVLSFIKNIDGVARFLGSGGVPSSISDAEAEAILSQVEKGSVARAAVDMYDVGEMVKIMDGPFESFNGVVQEVDNEKRNLRVLVSIFGRDTAVNLDFSQLEKIK